ncbi:Eco29kI family restriction endonuclease [Paucibacter sp. XJ19-41]|uniref:Eco29kI family restriction endonuclease n=1 Tax=Paucibacter sp. XJ19-41 TaxID=2927824 RepID=UPI00234BC579|nr:Eco29kI family restriction endonuclease [Paucibacter sp. XJ19-41]MDC6167649.1 Eco29kI family restriction endonuclease [Paucibacter sp. XJ19-41]
MSDAIPYNPLDKKNLGASVAEALLGRKPRPLGELIAFHGAGIYAIYYRGKAPAYERLAHRNHGDDPQAPIYVGKAIPEGARKGGIGIEGVKTRALYKRLSEHADSIRATPSLDIADFVCRYLVVDDIWIPLGESLLIAKFTPIWNSLIDGFGNHDPGKGRYQGMRPRWDVLHPGRSWAEKCGPRQETAEQIEREVRSHLELTQPPAHTHFYAEQKRGEYRVEPG